jgi:hypothetical protein
MQVIERMVNINPNVCEIGFPVAGGLDWIENFGRRACKTFNRQDPGGDLRLFVQNKGLVVAR